MTASSLIAPLPEGGLDIVGDIHGEVRALRALLAHLGYDVQRGQRPAGRTLVFVGDFVDRGPDSPAVVALIEQLCAAGLARAIVGNHEINLLAGLPKDGAGWFFDERTASDQLKYADFVRCAPQDKARIVAFLNTLPLALVRDDIRVVHSAWVDWAADAVRPLAAGSAAQAWWRWEGEVAEQARAQGLTAQMQAERRLWPHSLEDGTRCPPFLHAHSAHDLLKSRINPIKVLTSGLEVAADVPFFAGNKWRFIARQPWWRDYVQRPAVVVGHYWRSPVAGGGISNHERLFDGLAPFAWHGAAGNVFCVDYSVGARAQARRAQRDLADLRLAALRWPERELVFDDGSRHATLGFGLRQGECAAQAQKP